MRVQTVTKTTIKQATRPYCVGYCRISTQNQKEESSSIEVQKTKILEKIEEMGGVLAEEFYVDEAKSGTNIRRPGLTALLARCSNGDITHLLLMDSSRISRDTKDYLTIRTMLAKYKVEIVALTGISSFGNDPYSKFFDEILASVNSLHPRISGYKARQTAVEKFKAGYYPGTATLGYSNVRNSNPSGSYDKKIIVLDPDVSPFIKQAFKMYATGQHSIVSIRQYFYANGIRGRKGRPLQFSVTHNILRNPFYMGLMRWGGMEGQGKHEPLIDEPTFKRVQETLSMKGDFGIRTRKHNFLLRGLVFCKCCGKRYVAENHRVRSNNKIVSYYHCSQVGTRGKCPSAYANLKDLESKVEELVSRLEFGEDFIETVKGNITAVYTDSLDKVKLSKKAAYNRRDAVEMKREKLEEQMLSGNVGGENYKRMNAKLEADLLEVQKELAEIDKIRTIDVCIVEEVLTLTRNLARAYKQADTDHKRAYLHFFFQKIVVENKLIIDVEYTPALQYLQETNRDGSGILCQSWLRRQDSNLRPGAYKCPQISLRLGLSLSRRLYVSGLGA